MSMVKCKDKLYEAHNQGPWVALTPVVVPEFTGVAHRWTGGKISLDQLREAKAFLQWNHREREGRDEGLIHMYYNGQSQQWALFPPLQKGSGLHVETVGHLDTSPQHQEWLDVIQRAIGNDPEWDWAGTIHDHCKASAFQSGTDLGSEVGVFGLHITLGHLDKDVHDVHSRVIFKKLQTDAVLLDWFDIPGIPEDLPMDIKDSVAKFYLSSPVAADYPFPEHWKDSIVKSTYVSTYKPQEHNGYTGGGWHTGGNSYWDNQKKRNVEKLCGEWEVTPQFALAGLEEAFGEDVFLSDLWDVAVKMNIKYDDFIDILRELVGVDTEVLPDGKCLYCSQVSDELDKDGLCPRCQEDYSAESYQTLL